jgi:predicted O-linked N-acetylglucosamine transferase (SPINDLY family)
LTSIDAYISGRSAEPPEGASHYTEKLVCFDKVPIYDRARDKGAQPNFRREIGLEDGTLYACPMTAQKFHPDMDRLIARILAADPKARFAIPSSSDGTVSVVTARMVATVPALAGRLVTLPWLDRRRFTALLQEADAVLDTPHFGGSGTSRYAAAAGALMVTLEGRFMRGRLTAGMLIDMDLGHLVPPSEDAYVDLAVRIANDPPYRAQLAGELKDGSRKLIADRTILADFERCFLDLAMHSSP